MRVLHKQVALAPQDVSSGGIDDVDMNAPDVLYMVDGRVLCVQDWAVEAVLGMPVIVRVKGILVAR